MTFHPNLSITSRMDTLSHIFPVVYNNVKTHNDKIWAIRYLARQIDRILQHCEKPQPTNPSTKEFEEFVSSCTHWVGKIMNKETDEE